MWWEWIIIGLIAAAAGAYVTCRLVRRLRGKGGCGCGREAECKRRGCDIADTDL
jgi:hypothetical protein